MHQIPKTSDFGRFLRNKMANFIVENTRPVECVYNTLPMAILHRARRIFGYFFQTVRLGSTETDPSLIVFRPSLPLYVVLHSFILNIYYFFLPGGPTKPKYFGYGILQFVIFSMFLSLGTVQGQNIHFTRYDFQPLLLNPANSGSYSGSFRVTAIYRDQWANLLPNRFATPAISIDAPLGISFRDQDWIGVGVSFYQDRAGAGKLTTTGFNGYLSYHLALDKKQKNVLTLGLNGGSKTRKLGNINDFIFEDQTSGIGNLSLESKGGTVLGAGMLYSTSLNDDDWLRFGFSAQNLLPIDYKLTNSSNEKEIPEYNIHGEGSFLLIEDLAIEPSVVYQIKEGQNLGYGQARMAYTLDSEKNLRLIAGLGYRLGRAVQILAGVDYQGWRAGIGYDLNTNPLVPAQSFEIGMSYIGKIYKRPKVKEVILCPPF